MGFEFVRSDGACFKLNVWNWGTAHDALVRAKPPGVDLEKMALIRMTVGAELTAGEAAALAAFLETGLLPRFGESRRLTASGEVRNDPDDGTFHRTDLAANYSLDVDVLRGLIDFLKAADGPVQVF